MKKPSKSESSIHDVATAAANLQLPLIGGALYKAMKKAYEDRVKKVYEDFVMRAFDGNCTEEDIKKIQESESGECLLTILDRLQRDDEAIKSKIYADLYKAIRTKRVEAKFKWPVILAVCELRFDDLVNLCLACSEGIKLGGRLKDKAQRAGKKEEEVYNEYHRGLATGAGQITQSRDALCQGSTQRLHNAGLLRPGHGSKPAMPNELGWLTYNLLRNVVGELYRLNIDTSDGADWPEY